MWWSGMAPALRRVVGPAHALPAVLLTVVKAAANGDGAVVLWVMRPMEPPAPPFACAPFLQGSITVQFGAHEIETLLVPGAPAIDANLLERSGVHFSRGGDPGMQVGDD